MMEPILVSAVMVTGKTPAHERFARVAVDCFLRQSYPNKELVIVNDGPYRLEIKHPQIREIRPRDDEKLSATELRQLGFSAATGPWVIRWDDDDYHHLHRITIQMACRREGHVITLRRQMRVNLLKSQAFNCEDPSGFLDTALWENTGDARVSPAVVVDNRPERWPGASLYVKMFHGANATDEVDFSSTTGGQSRGELMPDQVSYLKDIMAEYGIPTTVKAKEQ